uniref:Putative ATPase domain containing protein n=1 Tax=viral metagenome TaxID=1070528 RepID=A0A6M3M400_9ZZZZ
MENEGMNIKSALVENFKGAKTIKITPKSNVTYICGDNGSGKTSFLDGMCSALENKAVKKRVINPIRKGEEKALVELDLGDIFVRRTWKGNKSYLDVFDSKGRQLHGAQGVLDAYIGHLALDPQAFSTMNEKQQRETFLEIVDLGGVDLDELAQERKDLYDERTISNRTIKDLKGHLAEMPKFPADTPNEEINIIDLTKKYAEASDHIVENNRKTLEIQNLQNEILEKEEIIKLVLSEIEGHKAALETLSTGVDQFVDPGLDNIKEDLENAETINKHVRLKADHAAKEKVLREEQEVSDEYTKSIEYIDNQKKEALEKANIPVPGLSIDDECVLFNNEPLSQCAASEQWEVCIRMAAAMNPKLKTIIIREGSLLDVNYMAKIKDFANKEGYQIWIEIVDRNHPDGIVIEDGEVVE